MTQPDGPLRIGITGHIYLSQPSVQLVYDEMVHYLRQLEDRKIVGVTCLADGADQLFARAVLEVGGRYEVILPAMDYRTKVIPADQRAGFDELLDRASEITYTGHEHSGIEAYVAAKHELLQRSQCLLAVWDGARDGDPGGTADVVDQARQLGLPTTVIWPDGAARTPSC
jgi:hypothetical protein